MIYYLILLSLFYNDNANKYKLFQTTKTFTNIFKNIF